MDRLGWLLIVGLLCAVPDAAIAEGLAVYANQGVGESELDRETLKAIYLQKRDEWSDGREIVLAQMSLEDPLSRNFYQELLDLSIQKIRRVQAKNMFRKRALIRSFGDPGELLRFISSNQSAIGFGPCGERVEGTKILLVNGMECNDFEG